MQNLDVKNTIQKIKKTKSEIRQKFEQLIAGRMNKNTDIKKVENCTVNKEGG